MGNVTAERYGRFYWFVRTPLSENGEIYLHADECEFRDGSLIFWQTETCHSDQEEREPLPLKRPLMIFAPGEWKGVFAASVMDGHAVAAEHWKGEIAESPRSK